MTKKSHEQEKKIVQIMTPQDLNLSDLEKEVKSSSFATWIRVLRQNWRQGTVGCKDRGDLTSRSTKKPWKQKGTGRARAGSARSPLWRGGGVTFGPQSRDRKLHVLRRIKGKLLRGLFHDFLAKNKILSIDWILDEKRPKTAVAYMMLKSIELIDKKVTLLLDKHDIITYASFINISHVRILYFDQLNAFDVANSGSLIFLKKDLEQFKEMVSKWI